MDVADVHVAEEANERVNMHHYSFSAWYEGKDYASQQ